MRLRHILITLILMAFLFAIRGGAQAGVPLVYKTVGFPQYYNDEITNRDADYPEGNNLVLGGIPFNIPAGQNNIWWSGSAGGSDPQVLEIMINLPFVREVHTLINTGWGAGGGPYAYLEFFGSAGAYFKKDLYGDVDIRDWNAGSYTNSINGTTTINVISTKKNHRVDKQVIVLPPEFARQTLVNMRMVDNGANGFQRTYLQGLTVGLNPPPSSPGNIELLLLE
jgi:hypothetical protein